MSKTEFTYSRIIKDLQEKRYYPIYYLMGEEPYFIDIISNYIMDNVLSETEKDFNLTVFYGLDVSIAKIINAAKRYPLMSTYHVVVVKEAQTVKNMDELSQYLQNPLKSTILVVCHKYGKLDRRKKLAVEIEKYGVLFDSRKIKEHQLPQFIVSYMQAKGVELEPKAIAMLVDYIGINLTRLTGELDKLLLSLPAGDKTITPQQVEQNIGISKEYNTFELRSALIEKNALKVYKIIKYFAENTKDNPIQRTLSVLFDFYAKLMLAYYAPLKSEQGVANMLGLQYAWQAKEYMQAMRNYSGVKTMQILHDIRYADAQSKGVDNNSTQSNDILRELIFKILH